MGRREKDEVWERPAGITLQESRTALTWFDINVSFDALRVLVHQLGIPHLKEDRSPSGRGRAWYFDYAVLWLLATVYAALYSPKTKAETVKKQLVALMFRLHRNPPRMQRLTGEMRESMADFFPPDGIDHSLMRRVYLAYITDANDGIDPRIITKVADGRWAETGLDEKELATALLDYKRRALIQMGVDEEAVKFVGLGSGADSASSGGEA